VLVGWKSIGSVDQCCCATNQARRNSRDKNVEHFERTQDVTTESREAFAATYRYGPFKKFFCRITVGVVGVEQAQVSGFICQQDRPSTNHREGHNRTIVAVAQLLLHFKFFKMICYFKKRRKGFSFPCILSYMRHKLQLL